MQMIEGWWVEKDTPEVAVPKRHRLREEPDPDGRRRSLCSHEAEAWAEAENAVGVSCPACVELALAIETDEA